MGRRLEHTVAATHGALVEGERIVAYGFCWAAQLQRVPLLFLRRNRYVMVLTGRRLLLFARRGRLVARPSNLVLGKRYEWFKLGRVRRVRPLLQVLVTTENGARMIFEFPPTRRELVRTLTAHLDDGAGADDVGGQPATGDPTSGFRGDDHGFWGTSTQSS
jgi:hypothetical protein